MFPIATHDTYLRSLASHFNERTAFFSIQYDPLQRFISIHDPMHSVVYFHLVVYLHISLRRNDLVGASSVTHILLYSVALGSSITGLLSSIGLPSLIQTRRCDRPSAARHCIRHHTR